MRFEFATAARVVFGEGTLVEAASMAREFGKRTLVVCGGSGRESRLTAMLDDPVVFRISGEPSVDDARSGAELARIEGCSCVVGFGGGSAIDAAKAIAGLAGNPGDPLDYLEVVGSGRVLANPGLPFLAVPTTAGAGAEVTRNAVLLSREHRVKASLRSNLLYARAAVVDPELTYALPPGLTAATGMDALTQLIEPYVSSKANPMTDALCAEGIRTVAWALPRAWRDGGDREARRAMARSSLLGGFALANAGLGAVHGFAAPIGGAFPAPHGAVCAALLPSAMEVNLRALRAKSMEAGVARYRQVASWLTGDAAARAEDGIEFVRRLCADLGIPPLRSYGIDDPAVPDLVRNAGQASSMKANPVGLTAAEMEEILIRAI